MSEPIATLQGLYFAVERLRQAEEKAARKVAMRFGAFVRQRAKTSQKSSKKVSRPGAPPSAHTKSLRNAIAFNYDARTREVVIGPVSAGGVRGRALRVLEFGGVGANQKLYASRPYMRPAFATELLKLPAMLAGMVR